MLQIKEISKIWEFQDFLQALTGFTSYRDEECEAKHGYEQHSSCSSARKSQIEPLKVEYTGAPLPGMPSPANSDTIINGLCGFFTNSITPFANLAPKKLMDTYNRRVIHHEILLKHAQALSTAFCTYQEHI